MFFGIVLYGLSGLRNLRHALGDALAHFEEGPPIDVSKGSVSPARRRMPVEVLREGWKHLLAQLQGGARKLLAGLDVCCLDGTGFIVADTTDNEQAYSRPATGKGRAAFPRMRSVLVMEASSHIFLEEAHGPFERSSEQALSDQVLGRVVKRGVLLEADRGFYSFERAARVLRLGGEFLVRIKQQMRLPVLAELGDGSYLSVVCCHALSKRPERRVRLEEQLRSLSRAELLARARAQRTELLGAEPCSVPRWLLMRVIEYEVLSSEEGGIKTRLLTSILAPEALSAEQAADGYHLRWSEEVGLRELKWLCESFAIPHFPGQSPESVEQDYACVLLSHSLLRSTMLLAAEEHGQDPTRLSLSGTRALIRRYLPRLPKRGARRQAKWFDALLGQVARQRLPKPKERLCPRAVKLTQSKWPKKCPGKAPPSKPVRRRFEFRSVPAPVP